MTSVFADTSFFVALLVPRDRYYTKATSLMESLAERIVTTDWVLVETANFMARSKTRLLVPSFIRDLQADTRFDIVPSTPRQLKQV